MTYSGLVRFELEEGTDGTTQLLLVIGEGETVCGIVPLIGPLGG
jgi:hypothetical protein